MFKTASQKEYFGEFMGHAVAADKQSVRMLNQTFQAGPYKITVYRDPKSRPRGIYCLQRESTVEVVVSKDCNLGGRRVCAEAEFSSGAYLLAVRIYGGKKLDLLLYDFDTTTEARIFAIPMPLVSIFKNGEVKFADQAALQQFVKDNLEAILKLVVEFNAMKDAVSKIHSRVSIPCSRKEQPIIPEA